MLNIWFVCLFIVGPTFPADYLFTRGTKKLHIELVDNLFVKPSFGDETMSCEKILIVSDQQTGKNYKTGETSLNYFNYLNWTTT